MYGAMGTFGVVVFSIMFAMLLGLVIVRWRWG